MAKEIYCESCQRYLGEIRDAKIRKETAMYCRECNKTMIAVLNWNIKDGYSVPDTFNKIFKGFQ